MPQAENHLLLRRQFPFRVLDGRTQLMGHDLAFRIGSFVDRLDPPLALFLRVAPEEADEPAPSQPVPRAGDGDPREPGFEFGAPLKLPQVRVRLDERVLRHRVRLDIVPHDGVGDAVDLALKAVDEDGKRPAITFQCAGDQFAIRRSRLVDLRQGETGNTAHCDWTHQSRRCLRRALVYAERSDPSHRPGSTKGRWEGRGALRGRRRRRSTWPRQRPPDRSTLPGRWRPGPW